MSQTGSDISSFAAWDANNSPVLAAREQSYLDMSHPDRVWADRESSNGSQSSDEESASGGVESMLRITNKLVKILATQFPSASGPNLDGETGNMSVEAQAVRTSVEDFAREHPFWSDGVLEEDEVAEFKEDVFEFGTAAGLSASVAAVVIMRAMGEWKSKRGIKVMSSHDAVEEAAQDLRVWRSHVIGGEHRDQPAEATKPETVINGDATGVKVGGSGRVDLQKRRKEEKKARQRLAKEEKAQSKSTATVDLVKRIKNEKKKFKKKAKPGPTTSSYFAALSEKLAGAPINTKRVTTTAAKKPVSLQTSDETYARVTTSMERADRLLVEAFEAGYGKRPEQARKSAEQADMAVTEALAVEKDAEGEELAENAASEKYKQKRKRKRNQNRLPEAETTPKTGQANGVADPKSLSEATEPPSKKKRVRSRIMKEAQKDKTPLVDTIEQESSEPEPTLDNKTKTQVAAVPDSVPATIVEKDLRPKKKARNRSKKSISKLLVTAHDEPAVTEPLAELTDGNSAAKKPKRSRSKKDKRSGHEVELEASNLSHS